VVKNFTIVLLFVLITASPLLFGQVTVDGAMNAGEGYTLLGGTATPSNSGFGSAIAVRRLYAKSDGTYFYLFLESKLNTGSNDHITIFLNFSSYDGLAAGSAAGGQGLYNSNTGFKLDMETDFAIDINPGSSSNAYIDFYRYFSGGLTQADLKMYLGNPGVSGDSATGPSAGTTWGGSAISANVYTFAFNNDGADNHGFEIKIPYSSFPGITSSASLTTIFAAIASSGGFWSNQSTPEKAGIGNLGNNADFTAQSFTFHLSPNLLLPVELSSFSATTRANNVQLNWKTATEVNNYGFSVQRSSDKNTWETLSFVKGAGNSNSPLEYSYTDKNLVNGTYYYRLRQQDNDGSFKYYAAQGVTVANAVKFQLDQNYPNPFNPTTRISFSIAKAGQVHLVVYNAIGQVVKTFTNTYGDAGTYAVTFDASTLPSGMYFYKIDAGSFSETKKMLLIK
jgi:hypothetical protein